MADQSGLEPVGSLFNSAAQALFATLLPSDCHTCHQPPTRVSQVPVCGECLNGMERLSGPLYGFCGERNIALHTQGCCGNCRVSAPPFVRAVAYGSYDGGLRELIHLLKYDRVRPAANVLGRMLAEAIEALRAVCNSAVVISVPLHRSNLRLRGFNQAEEIARAALKQLRRSELKLDTEVMQRRRKTETQTGLTDQQRRENVRGAFVVTASEVIDGANVLLIDDVFTTGATVTECARVLRRQGAKRVFVATVARVLKAGATWAVPQDIEQPRTLAAYA
jgi:ComF family protein